MIERGVEATSVGRPFLRAVTLLLAALRAVLADDRGAVEALAAELARLTRECGFRQLLTIGDVLCAWASDDADAIRQTLVAYEATGSRRLLHAFLSMLGSVEMRRGRHADALACVDRALEESEATGERFWEPEAHRLRAGFLLAAMPPRRDDALESLERGIVLARSQGAKTFEARIERSLRELRSRVDSA